MAEHADWWLSYGDIPAIQERKLAALADHCRDVGRDPWFDPQGRAPGPSTCIATGNARRRWAGDAVEGDRPAFAGDPAELRDRTAEATGLGFDMIQLRFAGLMDTTDIELFADEVLPHVR